MTADTSNPESMYSLLTSGEKEYYRNLNRRISLMRICQGFFQVTVVLLLMVLVQINVLIAFCCSMLYLVAMNSVLNELIRLKINRILFEKKVGFEKPLVAQIRQSSVKDHK